MKKLFVVVVLLLLVAGAAFRQSVYYALFRLSTALEKGDVATIEEHADLAALVKAPAHLASAIAEETGRRAAGDVAGAIAGAVVSALGGTWAEANVDELKRALARGDFAHGIGPFHFVAGRFPTVPPVDVFSKTALVTVDGTCEGAPATVTFVFERSDVGPVMGFPATWRATGVERASLMGLAKACAAGASSHGPAPTR